MSHVNAYSGRQTNQRSNGDDSVLWTLVKTIGNLEKKIDHLAKSQDRFIRTLRQQRGYATKLRGELARLRAYAKELETFLKLQREGDKDE